jgi:HSP20 family protein
MLALWRNGPTLDRSFDEFRREMDRLLWDFDRGFFSSRPLYRGTPRVTLSEKEDAFVVRAEVPGVAEKDLEISLDRGVLTIRGERSHETGEGSKVLRRERGSLRFSHSFTLPCRVDAESAKASLKDGVLELVLEKAEEEKPRQIPVASA